MKLLKIKIIRKQKVTLVVNLAEIVFAPEPIYFIFVPDRLWKALCHWQ